MDNLPDIKRRLKVRNLVVQAEAFQRLIQLLNHKEALNLFFDFIFETSIISEDWILRILHDLVTQNVLKENQIWDESIMRATEKTRKSDFFHVGVVDICKPKYRDFLKYMQRLQCSSKRIFGNEEVEKKFPKYSKLATLSGKDFKEKRKRSLDILKNCEKSQLVSDNLEYLDEFEILELLQSRPELVRNPNFTKKLTNLYLPALLEIVQSKLFNPDDLELYKKSIIACQQSLRNFEHPEEFSQFLARFPKEREDSRNLWVLLANLSTNPEVVSKRILELIEVQKDSAYTVIIYFISLFGKPYFKIERKLVVEVFAGLAVDLNSLEPVIRFLCAVSQMQIPEKAEIFKNMTKLMRKYPKCYDFVVPLCRNFDKNHESMEVFRAKLELAKECCISNDNCDEILSTLSKLLKDEDVRLACTIDVVSELCANNVLELKATRKQLMKKLGSCTEVVTLAYCRLLAIGAIPDKEETEENNLELRLEIIAELLEFSKSTNSKIVSEAWQSLQKYDLQEIPKFEFPRNLSSPQVLKPWLQIELDAFPRPFFAENWEVLGEFSSLDLWVAEISRLNVEWFAENTVSMIPIVMELTKTGDKLSIGMKYFKLCLTKISPVHSTEDVATRQLSWKLCVSSIFSEMFERSQNLIQSRNDICMILSNFTFERHDSSDILMIIVAISEAFEENLRISGKLECRKDQEDWMRKVWNWIENEDQESMVFKSPLKSQDFIKEYCRDRLLNPNTSICTTFAESSTSNRKEIEKAWSSATDKREIYEKLAEKSRNVWKTRKFLDQEKLRGGMFFEVLQNLETDGKWLDCFVGLKRTDGRPLPPINWLKLVEKSNNRLAVIQLACQERLPEPIIKLEMSLESSEILEISQYNLSFLPVSVSQNILAKYLEMSENWDLSNNRYDMWNILTQKIPKIENFAELFDPILMKINEKQGFAGKISRNFDILAENRDFDRIFGNLTNGNFLQVYIVALESNFGKFVDFLVFKNSKMEKTTENQEKLLSLFYAFVISKSPNKFFIRDFSENLKFGLLLSELAHISGVFKFFVDVLENSGISGNWRTFAKDFLNYWIREDSTKLTFVSENVMDFLLE